MLKSLFILMIVALMAAVGLYYEDQAGASRAGMQSGTDSILTAATAVRKVSVPEPVSGVNLEALDRATRPQDDFYQLANGGCVNRTEIPEIHSGYTVYHQVNEETEKAHRKIVKTAARNRVENGTESQQAGHIYNNWMNTEAIHAIGSEPIAPELELAEAIDNTASTGECHD